MAIKISKAVARLLANTAATAVDAGAADSTLVIYTGPEPADADVAVTTQTELVEFVLPGDTFKDAVDVAGAAVIEANAIAEVDAAADGVAAWFRMYDGDGNPILQGNVTNTAGNGNLKVSSTDVVEGIAVEIVSMSYRQRTA